MYPAPSVIWKPAATGNFQVGRSAPISRITFHHIVGDAPAAIARFQTPGEQASSTYVIGSTGQIYHMVQDQNTPYTDGNFDSNSRAITIEHAGGHASVPYTPAMYDASKRLCAYLISKYKISDFKRHRDVSSKPTACPGGLDVEGIVAGAKALIQGGEIVKPTEAQVYDAFRRYALKEPANPEEVKFYMDRDIRVLYQSLLDYAVIPKVAEVEEAFKKLQPWAPINQPPYTDQTTYYSTRAAKALYYDLAVGLKAKLDAAGSGKIYEPVNEQLFREKK